MAAQHSQHQPAPAHPHPHAANQASGNCSSNSHSNSSPDDDDFSWITSQDLVTLKEMGDESGLRPRDAVLRQHIKTLPKGSKPVRFVGEGAANAVFEFRVPEASRLAPEFKGFLLRVAKVPALGQPLSYDYLLQQRFFHTVIKPALGEHTVHQELVILRRSNIINELNKLLQSINHLRKEKFRGSFVGQSDWGLLLEDMRPEDPEESVLIEFKPKWLLQSPSAPPDAIRCRQCAMDLQNFILDPSGKKPLPQRKPCPLTLGNKAPRQVSSPFRIAPQLADDVNAQYFAEALRSTANHAAIATLRAQQADLDHNGPLNAKPTDLRFVLAMTIRDCTCFAQISRQQHSSRTREPLKLRLGDFDWKDPKVKFERWRSAEEDLVEGGFYTADWIRCGQTYYHPPTLCMLEWTTGKRTGDPGIIHVHHGREFKRRHAKHREILPAQFEGGAKIFYHRADLGVIEPALAPFRKDAPEGPPDVPRNPYRREPQ